MRVARKRRSGAAAKRRSTKSPRGNTGDGHPRQLVSEKRENSAMACRPGNAVQTSGGGGMKIHARHERDEPQKQQCEACLSGPWQLPQTPPTDEQQGRLSACRMASDKTRLSSSRHPAKHHAARPMSQRRQESPRSVPTGYAEVARSILTNRAVRRARPCVAFPALPHADFMRHFG